jgi:hypothetical protein
VLRLAEDAGKTGILCRATSAQVLKNSQIIGFLRSSTFVVCGTEVEKAFLGHWSVNEFVL